MANEVLALAKIYVSKYDLTADLNKATLNSNCNLLDNTVFNETTRGRFPGLTSADLSLGGFIQLGTTGIETILNTNLAAADTIITVCPTASGAESYPAYYMKSIQGEFAHGGAIGDMYTFTMGAYSNTPLIRGIIIENGAVTGTAASTSYQIGAVTAAQKLYAVIHCTAVSGTNPTLAINIESDATGAFGGAQTVRGSFTGLTVATSEWKEISGAITDAYWRANYTIGGTNTPTFTVMIAFGVK